MPIANAPPRCSRLAPGQATLERALALTWLQRSLGQDDEAIALKPQGDWRAAEGTSGEGYWLWQGQGVPAELELPDDLPHPVDVRLDFNSAQAAPAKLDVEISRSLMRLVPGEEPFSFTAEEVKPEDISSDDLYLDTIVLTSKGERALRYGMLEVPLPPGADVERTTWGIKISGLGGEEAETLERARNEPGQLLYAVPVDSLQGSVVLQHLVRFSQKGSFELPPARQRLYAPRSRRWRANRRSDGSRLTRTRHLAGALLMLAAPLLHAGEAPLSLAWRGPQGNELLQLDRSRVLTRGPCPPSARRPWAACGNCSSTPTSWITRVPTPATSARARTATRFIAAIPASASTGTRRW